MLSELLEYVERERVLTDEELEESKSLPLGQLVDKGLAIDGLTLVKQVKDQVLFKCEINNSKVKVGDKVTFENQRDKCSATVVENLLNEITLRFDPPFRTLATDATYTIRVNKYQFLNPIIESLRTLVPGSPGMYYCNVLCGKEAPIDSLYGGIPDSQTSRMLQSFRVDLNQSQKAAIIKSLKRPSLLAIQGPPGTGKTLVLTLVAELFSSLGMRVAILAPTHQAINTCLNEIGKYDSHSQVYKIGEILKSEGLSPDIKTLPYREFQKAYRKKKLADNSVIGTTFYSAIIHLGLRASSFAPNVILIDEAGQIPLAYGMLSGIFGAGSIIYFGDDAQMPPVFHPKLAHHPLSKSIFQQIRDMHPTCIHPLNVSYRLNSTLCELLGNLFYLDNSGNCFLKSVDKNAGRKLELDFPEGTPDIFRKVLNGSDSLVWINSVTSELCTDSNKEEASAVARLVYACLQSGLTTKDLAVVTPFRKQSTAIRTALHQIDPNLSEFPVIDTVERVQGTSVEVIIISYASNDIAYIRNIAEFLYSPNRLNVALSRSKSKAILFVSEIMIQDICRTAIIHREPLLYISKKANANYDLKDLLVSDKVT